MYLDLEGKNHPSFAIVLSLGYIQNMFMYINTLRLSTLIIYSSKTLFKNVTSLIIYANKTLPIYHHGVNKSEQGEEADFEINCVILQKIQIRV